MTRDHERKDTQESRKHSNYIFITYINIIDVQANEKYLICINNNIIENYK